MSIPRNEYPRPTLRRDDKTWLNLNGQWEFAFDFGNSGRDRSPYRTAPNQSFPASSTLTLSPPAGTEEKLLFPKAGAQNAAEFSSTSAL